MRARWLIPLAVALLFGLLTLWFLNDFERYTVERKVGISQLARANPLLAAERFLRRMGLPAGPAPDLLASRFSLPADALLIIDAPRAPLGERGHQQLLEWVRGGGQLVVEAPSDPAQADADPLLREFSVTSEQRSIDHLDEAREAMLERTRDAFGLAIALDPTRVLYTDRDDMLEAFGDADTGYHVLRFPLGEGVVTLFSDLAWLRNERIGKHDHARLLHRLAERSQASQILLAHDLRSASLLERLLDRIPMTFVAIGIAVVLVLLRVTRRFGPLRRPAQAERRRLLEHLEASGYYLWGEGFAGTLLDAARQRVRRKLYQLWPDLEHLPDAEQRERLAEITRLSSDSIDHALFAPARAGREGFTRQVRLLEQLRKRL